MPQLKDLPQDIYSLFDPEKDHKVSEENLEEFARNCKELLRRRLEKQPETTDRPIRFSSLGKPDRQVWFDANPDPMNEEKMPPKTYVKFMYGDILEQLILFLSREAGHIVEDTQKQVEHEGITGSIDAVIDGVLTDVKSASSFGYKKFAQDTVEEDDPFGYVAQLSGYANKLTPGEDAAWVAIDKVSGDICISTLKSDIIEKNKPEPRIEHLKKIVQQPEIPPLCHLPVPDGKSGNMKLPTPCSYCKHKFRCHPDLRVFFYSTGPRFLTKVARQPDVPEM